MPEFGKVYDREDRNVKWMVASDLHGSAYYCRKMFQAYDAEKADRLLFLGDILYHGPRNDLPEEYNTKEVMKLLNERKKDLVCIRGNCDATVDQMVLDFPVLAEYCVIESGGILIYASHGHIFSSENLPPLQDGDVFLQGHTHVPLCENKGNILCMNPGSVSLPKENSYHGYMIMEDGEFVWKDFDGQEYHRIQLR